MRKTAIICLQQHWRLDDQPLLKAAANFDELLLVYPFENEEIPFFPLSIKRIGPFRIRKIKEAITNFNMRLKPFNQQLWLAKGNTVEVMSELLLSIPNAVAFLPDEPAYDEQKAIESLTKSFGKERVKTSDIGSLFKARSGVLNPADCPEMFTQFRKAVEARFKPAMPEDEPLRLPPRPLSLPENLWNIQDFPDFLPEHMVEPDSRGGKTISGGEKSALKRLNYYLEGKQLALQYKETRNGLVGTDYSTRFSPFLALGTLSPRRIMEQLHYFESEFEANESTYWIYFELLWREYFRVIARKHGKHVFLYRGMQSKNPGLKGNTHAFLNWCEGQTGQPFIDACMKELKLTGWLSNRGRQNVASYLVHHLKLDWRWGAWWFEHCLIDFDPASNWCNWQYVAGIGQDPRGDRVFDPIRQSNMYDQDGRYRKLWNS